MLPRATRPVVEALVLATVGVLQVDEVELGGVPARPSRSR
jgi:hypothetical protein